MDSTKSIIKSAGQFSSGTALSRVTGFLRDISMAFAFGTSSSIAAFFVAFRFAHILRRLMGEGGFKSAFIPRYEELKNDDPERACRFFGNLYVIMILILVTIITSTMGTLWGVLHFFELSPGNQEILTLTMYMMPSLFFISLYGLNVGILQCERHFFIASSAPVFFNFTWIGGALFIWIQQPTDPMLWLCGVIIMACFMQWAVTLPHTSKILIGYGLPKPWRGIQLLSNDMKRIGKPVFFTFVGVAAIQTTNVIDAIFARYADSEGPALLWYAIRLQQMPLALFAVGLSGALLPPLSRALKENDHARFRHFLRYSMRTCFWIMIPSTLALFFFGRWGIQIAFGRGEFTEHAINGTTYCLWGYALGLLPMSMSLVIAPAFYAKGKYGVPATASILSTILNLGLNYLFIIGFGLGPYSVAITTSLSGWFSYFLLSVMLKRQDILVTA